MPGQSFRGFAEKVAVVTNGAQGIGRAVALQLALQGAYVIVSHTKETEENVRAMQSLREIGTLAYSVETDVSKLVGVRTLFSSVEEMYGRLDLLINCAAPVNEETSLDQLTEESWQRVIDNNLKSALFCAQAAIILMNGRPSPAIVNVAYECEGSGKNKNVQFAASQAGLIGLTQALSNELKPRRIRVNCVAIEPSLIEKKKDDGPGFVSSPFDDAARAIVYLLSSEAKAVSGQTIKVG